MMTESLEDVLNSGFATWRSNLILGAPFILDLITSLVFLAIPLFIGLFVGIAFVSLALSDLSNIDSLLLAVIILMIVGIILFVLLLAFVGAFFEAGAIGMTLAALRTGRAKMGDMLHYSKKNTVQLFLASLLTRLIMLSALVIGALVTFGVWSVANTFSQLLAWVAAMILSVVLILCMIYLWVILSPAKYIIVIDDLGPVSGVRRAYRFSMDNRFNVFLMWLITAVIAIIFSVLNYLAGAVLGMVPFVGIVLNVGFSMILAVFEAATVSPLLTCWWTLLCIGEAKKKDASVAPNLEAARPSPENPSSGPYYV